MELISELISELIKHSAIVFWAGVVLAALSLLGYLASDLVTSIFSQIKIAGNWETRLDKGAGLKRHEDATLHQFIHKVWGRTTTTDGHKYRVKGKITGERLYLTYRATKGGTDCGGSLLKIATDVKTISGFEVGSGRAADALYSYRYEWTKKP